MATLTPRPQMAVPPAHDDDPYRALVAAILARALCDAHGLCLAPGASAVAWLQQEARAWLADEQAVRELLELCGVDAEPVLRRIRQQLVQVSVPHQLTLL